MAGYRPYSRRLHENFRLSAGGAAFDVDAFLAASTLKPDRVVHQGEQRPLADAGVVYDISGFEIVLGDGLSVPFNEQQAIAAGYLKARHDEFWKLRQTAGVEDCDLHLEFTTDFMNPSTTGFGCSLTWRLMSQCVAAGVRVNVFVSLARSGEDAEPASALPSGDS